MIRSFTREPSRAMFRRSRTVDASVLAVPSRLDGPGMYADGSADHTGRVLMV